MNGVLWALQVFLAFAFLTVGWMHAFRSRQMAAGRPGMGWVLALPPSLMTFIGICEMLGALGLVLPPVTGVDPWLVPLAAAGLAAIMFLAAIFHIARRERPNLVINGVLFGLAVIVAYGRFAVVPLWHQGAVKENQTMFATLFPLSTDVGLLILRLGFAFVFIVHGWPKLNPSGPLKGPAGFAGWLRQMGVPLPMLFAWIVALLETIGAGLVILGLATRLLALAFAVIMLVAIWAKRRFMKVGFTAQQGTGWELDFGLLSAAMALVFAGAGALALDPLVGF